MNPWIHRLAALTCSFACVGSAPSQEVPLLTDDGFLRATPNFRFEFPRDSFAHDGYKIEWWYFTGHLESEATVERPAAKFGYQFTFFRIGLAPQRSTSTSQFASSAMIMGHAAVTDLSRREHRFRDVIWRDAPLVGGFERYRDETSRRIASCPAAPGGGEDWILDWNGAGFDFAMADQREGGFEFALSTRPDPRGSQEPRLQGEHGYSPKDPSGSVASLYYSLPRLDTKGSITIGGVRHEVTGSSWMDHEISSDSLSDAQVGWDWFALKLEDGRDVMLYRLRGRTRADDFVRGSMGERGGPTRYLDRDAIELTPRRSWRSDRTRSEYPVEWEVVVEGARWKVVPMLDAAENVAEFVPNLHYWEGPVEVFDESGKQRLGVGYVELTGYGENARLPL